MKVKAKIFQLIKWEERKKYFFSMDFGETKLDLLHVGVIEKDGKWHDRSIFGLFKSLLGKDHPTFKYENMIFHQNMVKAGFTFDGLPILVERPNNYEVGDEVEIDINVSLLTSASQKEHNSD